MSFFSKLFDKKEKETLYHGLKKTREGFFTRLVGIVTGKTNLDEELLTQLEEALLGADVGVETTVLILERVEQAGAKQKVPTTEALQDMIRKEIEAVLLETSKSASYDFTSDLPSRPYVILVMGVNGVGKTTTIGKLAYNFKVAGKTVLLGAADTFRAAAVEQLTIWSERIGVPIVKQKTGSDPAAVAFDTVQSARSKNTDVVLIDTAGRLHNKAHLMEELSKIKRVIQKSIPNAPHEILLVLDGSTGQNALEQARHFAAVTPITALAVTKLDGTAKGGIVLAIAHQLKIPVKFIGVGEQAADLLIFDQHSFVESLFAIPSNTA
ncbi:MAG: signal recognition particle-docking protein FtsY [Bacteroidetes bacterium]|nr:signal recognition particle-docking protein FtsY [Bacteroidota bacterium]